MIRFGTVDDLNLVATERVRRLPQAAVNPLLDLIAAHYLSGERLTRDTFLLLADEAEAVSRA